MAVDARDPDSACAIGAALDPIDAALGVVFFVFFPLDAALRARRAIVPVLRTFVLPRFASILALFSFGAPVAPVASVLGLGRCRRNCRCGEEDGDK